MAQENDLRFPASEIKAPKVAIAKTTKVTTRYRSGCVAQEPPHGLVLVLTPEGFEAALSFGDNYGGLEIKASGHWNRQDDDSI